MAHTKKEYGLDATTGAVLAVLLWSSAGCVELDVPQAPSVEAVLSDYAYPTGVLDETSIAMAVMEIERSTDQVEKLDLMRQLPATLESSLSGESTQTRVVAADEPGEASAGVFGPNLSGGAVVRIRQICSGADEEGGHPNPERDGNLEIVATATDPCAMRTAAGETRASPTAFAIGTGNGPATSRSEHASIAMATRSRTRHRALCEPASSAGRCLSLG